MKTRIFIVFIVFSLSLTAQTVKRDTVRLIPLAAIPIDTSFLIPMYDRTIDFDLNELSVRVFTDADKEKILIDKKLLIALLRPYYNVQLDSVKNDTLVDASFSARYRRIVNSITNDTSYVALPKTEKYIKTISRLKIDTLKIPAPIEILDITARKFADDPIWWRQKNSVGIDISEATFVNWNTGGNNSIAGLLKLNLTRQYKKLHTLWNNEVAIRYGLNNQQDVGLRKTDDKIEYNSTFGHRRDTISNWFYSVNLNFRTQFTEGYSYPDTSNPISSFFAPAYLFLGAGTHYELKDRKFSIYLSPVTLKSTFVLDNTLSQEGAFGVEKGSNSRHEFGFLVQNTWDVNLMKNVGMSHKLSLYSDYLHKFGNIDVNWELQFHLTINKFLKANLSGFLVYDDDTKYKKDINGDGKLETLGPRVQFKQLLGIGVLFLF